MILFAQKNVIRLLLRLRIYSRCPITLHLSAKNDDISLVIRRINTKTENPRIKIIIYYIFMTLRMDLSGKFIFK